jgi:hypothetical protein
MTPVVGAAEDVTVGNLIRAETDHMIRENMRAFGIDIGEIVHLRQPTTPENQPVIRMNQDTLYSGVVLDLSEPAHVALPDIGGRYMSMMVISQDHFISSEATPGTYELTQDGVGTRFAFVAFRTFVDVTNPDDIAATHAAQDAIEISGGGDGPFEAPDWDLDQLALARTAINNVSTLGFDASRAYGSKAEVNPVDHLIGAIAGWGGLPAKAAIYLIDAVDENDGITPHTVTVEEVPVDAFWSVTVYNAEGYLEPNDLHRNNFNNFTAQPNENGSITMNFGACEDGRINCIPITPGWNYAVRLYQPRMEIRDGSWTFPTIEPVR